MKDFASKLTKRMLGQTPYKGNLVPSQDFVQTVILVLEQADGPIRIAEIGVDKGASTREVSKLLRPRDVLDLFDRESCDLFKNADSVLVDCKASVSIHASTTRLFDSYAWLLAKQLTSLLQEGKDAAIWDVVYLDGAHTFPVDAPATCCLKEMIKVGGYLILDDMNWTYCSSPTVSRNNQAMMRFSDEQNAEPHVRLVADAFVRTDARYEEISPTDAGRAIFRRMM